MGRLSIQKKYDILPIKLIDFMIYSIHISANPLHSEYGIICDSFSTKTIIKNNTMLPLQHRIFLTHFVDIEEHNKLKHLKQRHIESKRLSNNIYIQNRLITNSFN